MLVRMKKIWRPRPAEERIRSLPHRGRAGCGDEPRCALAVMPTGQARRPPLHAEPNRQRRRMMATPTPPGDAQWADISRSGSRRRRAAGRSSHPAAAAKDGDCDIWCSTLVVQGHFRRTRGSRQAAYTGPREAPNGIRPPAPAASHRTFTAGPVSFTGSNLARWLRARSWIVTTGSGIAIRPRARAFGMPHARSRHRPPRLVP